MLPQVELERSGENSGIRICAKVHHRKSFRKVYSTVLDDTYSCNCSANTLQILKVMAYHDCPYRRRQLRVRLLRWIICVAQTDHGHINIRKLKYVDNFKKKFETPKIKFYITFECQKRWRGLYWKKGRAKWKWIPEHLWTPGDISFYWAHQSQYS